MVKGSIHQEDIMILDVCKPISPMMPIISKSIFPSSFLNVSLMLNISFCLPSFTVSFPHHYYEFLFLLIICGLFFQSPRLKPQSFHQISNCFIPKFFTQSPINSTPNVVYLHLFRLSLLNTCQLVSTFSSSDNLS